MKTLSTAIFAILFTAAYAQDGVFGKWVTIDDVTGDKKSVVEIYKCDGKVCGKIIKLFRTPDQDPDPLCDKCPEDDARYNQKVIGMEIMRNMEADDDEYSGGTILKPDEGTIYRCRIWIDDEGNLKVRGYWGFLYRTQTWHRYKPDE